MSEGLSVERVGVAGAGTMGAGIAQLACLGGFRTILHDPDRDALARGERRLRAALLKGVDRERWTHAEAEAASARLIAAPELDDLAECQLVIEAAPEQLELKRELFARLSRICADDAVLATNTSSLPVSAIGAAATHPERTCGMHFFNPPALMRLVEVVAGERSSEGTIATALHVAGRMDRDPVRAADAVGFIVNRCNRPFTLEALRIVGERIARPVTIDLALRERAGFRMGPFELMDLVGIDVNLAVARSFFEQRPLPRWRPHRLQKRLVELGRLGRKADRGFYRYAGGRRLDPPGEAPAGLTPEARAHLAALGLPAADAALAELVARRVLCQLANEAHFAAEEGVATPADIDTAMRLGLNHPRGPFEWTERLGPDTVVDLLDRLAALGDGEVYDVAGSLRRAAAGARSAQAD